MAYGHRQREHFTSSSPFPQIANGPREHRDDQVVPEIQAERNPRRVTEEPVVEEALPTTRLRVRQTSSTRLSSAGKIRKVVRPLPRPAKNRPCTGLAGQQRHPPRRDDRGGNVEIRFAAPGVPWGPRQHVADAPAAMMPSEKWLNIPRGLYAAASRTWRRRPCPYCQPRPVLSRWECPEPAG